MKPFNQWQDTFSSVLEEVDTQRMKYSTVIYTQHQMSPLQTATSMSERVEDKLVVSDQHTLNENIEIIMVVMLLNDDFWG